jgi:hypothetical protein
MDTYKDRLLIELAQLSDRVQKLTSFRKTQLYLLLSKEKQELLTDQLYHMGEYEAILKQRIELENK